MQLPVLGERLPTQGNRVTRALAGWILGLFRWRIEGTVPNREKLVIIVAPHTTAWDFGVAITLVAALGLRASWLGIAWIFRYPLMRAIGGIPVDRSKSEGIVERAIEEFGRRERYVLGLSPEGSRSKVVPWKTGFYRIATGVGVPIFLIAFDPREKWVQLGPMFEPTGDYEADMNDQIRPFYAEAARNYPDRFGF